MKSLRIIISAVFLFLLIWLGNHIGSAPFVCDPYKAPTMLLGFVMGGIVGYAFGAGTSN
jgi:hypothetical protein